MLRMFGICVAVLCHIVIPVRRVQDIWTAKKGTYDISKIPDVYDCAKYDAIHNQTSLGLKELGKLYDVSRVLTEFIAPSEYGMTRRQKLDIGERSRRLLEARGAWQAVRFISVMMSLSFWRTARPVSEIRYQ